MAIGYQIVVPYLRNEERPYLDAGVNAFDGDKRVGYIRAEWISSALIDQTLPTVWHYAHEFEGISVGISAESDLSDYQTLLHLWRRAYSYEAWGFRPPSQRNKGLSPGSSLREHHPSAMEIVSDLDALARYRGYDVAFEKFKQRQDYVFVGYSKVEDGSRLCFDLDKQDQECYQGRGIGTRLYQLMAMWLAVHMNTSLHQSSLCSKDAQALWEYLLGSGYPVFETPTPNNNKSVFELDYTRSPELLAEAGEVLAGIPETEHPEFLTPNL